LCPNSIQIYKGIYTSYDRVILRGYIPWLFACGCLINFLRDKGFRAFTNGVLRIFTDQLNSHITNLANKHGISIVWWPGVRADKDDKMLDYVHRTFRTPIKLKGNNYVYGILTNTERATSFATRTLSTKKGKPYDKMYRCSKHVKHIYIYVHDELLGGPCYLKICTYFPFTVEFYFNGHNLVSQSLDQQGIPYRMDGNAFTSIDDTKRIEDIVWSLSGREVQERIDFWMNHFFRFNKGKYSTVPNELHHKWYCHQVEICTNVIFKSAGYCTRLFDRLLDKFSRIGSPDTISQIFGKRRTRKDTKSTRRLYDNKACIKHWLINNAIKFYNKLGYYLRVETTINNPKLLGLNKPVFHLREYLSYGIKCNERLYDCYADVDVKTIGDDVRESLTRPIEKANGQKVAAPDLRKGRQLALFKELLKDKYYVHGFKTRTLANNLLDYFQNIAQIRYELKKLVVRGLAEKVKGKSFWRVTKLGHDVVWIQTTFCVYGEDPLISVASKSEEFETPAVASRLEEAHEHINKGLSMLTKELFLDKAA